MSQTKSRGLLLILMLIVLIHQVLDGRAAANDAAKNALIGRDFIITGADSTNSVRPAVAYNTTDHQYLVVWSDDRNVANGQGLDIYGRRLDADGAPLGKDFPIATAAFNQQDPLVVYNSGGNQYLVIWTDERNFLTDGTSLYGQIIGADGRQIANNFLIAAKMRFVSSRLIYNSVDDYYLVVWYAEGRTYGQRIGADARRIGNAFSIGLSLRPGYNGLSITYNSAKNHYLVTWTATRGVPPDEFHASYAQILQTDGTFMASPVIIANALRVGVGLPNAAHNSRTNEYLAVYSTGNSVNLYGQRIAADGTLISNPFRIATPGTWDAAITYNPTDNEYLVVWADLRRSPQGSFNLYGHRIGSDGLLIGKDLLITNRLSDYLAYTSVTYNRSVHQYLTVWQTRRSDGRGINIYGRGISADGLLMGTESLLAPDPDPGFGLAPYDKYASTVAHNSEDNQYLVVWQEARDSTTSEGNIYGRLLNAEGHPISNSFSLTRGPRSQSNPAAIYNSADRRYLVIWSDSRAGMDRRRIYGQLVATDGRLLGEEIPVATGSWNQLSPAVAYNSMDNEYLIVWVDERTRTSLHIYGRRVGSDGNLIADDFPISTASSFKGGPTVTYNGVDNQYLIAWTDGRTALESRWDIYGQIIAADGQLLSKNFPIVVAPMDQKWQAVAYNRTDNEYMVVWLDERNSPFNTGIYGRRVGADGRLLGDDFPIRITSRAVLDVQTVTVAHNYLADEYVVVWDDSRNSPFSYTDLYGQRLAADGRLIAGDFPVAIAPDSQRRPALVYNGIDNRHLVVWYDARHSHIFNWDIYGQFIR